MLATGDERPLVSVLVILWNAAPFLDDCLGALLDDPTPIEVHCWDNASEDGSAAIAEGHGCTVVRSETNVGFPRAVNRLLPEARADVVLLLNPDVRLQPGTLARCLAALGEPGVGMVGANLRRPDGQPDLPAARRFRSLTTIALESFGLAALWRRFDVQYLPTWDRSTSRDVPCINGAFMLLPTRVLRELGGLDETVFLYLEDQELCRAVGARGDRIRFVADAVATHVGGGSTEASSPERRAIAYQHRLDASLEIVLRRQGSAARLAALVILVLRCGVLLLVATGRRDAQRRLKYRAALGWLRRQVGGRVAPPPVP